MSRDAEAAVLVVDDEQDIREGITDVLTSALENIRVITANDGQSALDILDREKIDVIITDYRMPGMDGLEFLNLAKAKAPEVPRIIMTAYGDLEVALRAINEAEVHRFFRKPLDPEEVVHCVWSLFSGPDEEN